MVADSIDSYEQRKQFFNKLDNITKGYELKKQTPHWFDHEKPTGEISQAERSAEEKQEQLRDKKLYTIFKVVEGTQTPVAWNVPRIEKDAVLLSVFKPRLMRISGEDGIDSVMIEFKAIPNDEFSPISPC